MFIRALIAFLVLPGMVAFIVPVALLYYTDHTQLIHPAGCFVLMLGIAGLLWCVRDFYVAGKGTLAPWAPPRKLVIIGLYRHTRNPMYVSVALILFGWAVSFGALVLYGYTVLIVILFHLRVVYGEEPWLAQTHGNDWKNYAGRVPRWFWQSSPG